MIQSSSNSNRRLTKWHWIVLGAGMSGFLVLTMVLPIVAQNRTRATYADLAAAKFDAPGIFERIGKPPQAKEAGFRSMDTGPKQRSVADAGEAWVNWSHSHEVPMNFEQVLAWYTPRLVEDGWKVHDPKLPKAAAYC